MNTYIIKGGNCLLGQSGQINGKLLIQLDWRYPEAQADDVDASLFLLNSAGKVGGDADFIFYNQRVSQNGGVRHLGSADTEIEQCKGGFWIDLGRIPDGVERLAIALTRHSESSTPVTLKGLYQGFLEIRDAANQALAHYEFSNDIVDEAALIVGEVYRHTAGWKFRAIGQGFLGGLGALAIHYGVCLAEDEAPSTTNTQDKVSSLHISLQSRRKRRSPNTVLMEHTQEIKTQFERFLPHIQAACDRQENETRTRMILDQIFREVLGYPMENVKVEQNIEGRKADYVLAVDGQDVLVVEVKRAGMAIRERQIFQATSYGAYGGIRWALLTNLVEWQLYRISTGDRIEANLVFSVQVSKGLDAEAAYRLALISFYGFQRKGLLEKLWLKRSTLSYERLVAAVLNQDVVSKIRIILSNEAGVVLTQEEVQTAIERTLLHLE